MSQATIVDLPSDRLEAEVVAAFYFEDVRPLCGGCSLLDWRMNGRLSHLLASGQVTGRAGEQILIANNGKLAAEWVLWCGGGRWQGLGTEGYRGLVRHLLQSCSDAGFSRVALCLTPLDDFDASALEKEVSRMLRKIKGSRLECLLCFDAEEPSIG